MVKQPHNHRRDHRNLPRGKREGAALLISLFVIFFVTVTLVTVLDTETIQQAAHRNVTDYERALHLANAAVHHVLAELEEDEDWRGTVTDGAYPADDTYQGTAVDGTGSQILVTGVGVAGGVERSVDVTVEAD